MRGTHSVERCASPRELHGARRRRRQPAIGPPRRDRARADRRGRRAGRLRAGPAARRPQGNGVTARVDPRRARPVGAGPREREVPAGLRPGPVGGRRDGRARHRARSAPGPGEPRRADARDGQPRGHLRRLRGVHRPGHGYSFGGRRELDRTQDAAALRLERDGAAGVRAARGSRTSSRRTARAVGRADDRGSRGAPDPARRGRSDRVRADDRGARGRTERGRGPGAAGRRPGGRGDLGERARLPDAWDRPAADGPFRDGGGRRDLPPARVRRTSAQRGKVREGMSPERKRMIEAYGAELVLTPGSGTDIDLAIAKMREIVAGDPERYYFPGEFENPDNPAAQAVTGEEIWEQTNGDVHAVVAAQGTGGWITGVARALKAHDPAVQAYAVEPSEAPLISEQRWGTHGVPGIGDGIIPPNLDLDLMDGIVVVSTDDALAMALRLAREEGM